MCDMAHDGDGATEASFTSDAEGLIYVVLQMAVWVMDEVRCVELQTAVQHEYGGASSVFVLEVRFPGDEDWAVVAMKSLTADYADQIGFKGQLLLEPKPREPMAHQYNFDAETTLGFLG